MLMLVVENEHEVERCGRIETLTRYRPTMWSERLRQQRQLHQNASTTTTTTKSSLENSTMTAKRMSRKDYSINRYRKNPEYCHNYYANESNMFFCNSPAISYLKLSSSSAINTIYLFLTLLFSLVFL